MIEPKAGPSAKKRVVFPHFFWKGFIAYIVAITAVLCLCETISFSDLLLKGGFAESSSRLDLARWGVFELISMWLLVFIFTIIPFSVSFFVARRLGFFNMVFFLIVGIGGAVLMALVFAAFMPSFLSSTGDDLFSQFMEQFRRLLPRCIAYGAVAGLAFWSVLKLNPKH